MKINELSVEAALASLGTTAIGLDAGEASRRLREFGPNQIHRVARTPTLVRLLREFVQFFSVILWAAAALAFIAEWSAPGEGMGRIGVALVACILVSGLFSFWQEHRVERTLNALLKLLPRQATLLRAGEVVRAPVEDVVPGDLVLLDQGDVVPADCRVIEGFSLKVDNSTVTGESMPQPRNAAASANGDLLHSRNILLAGTSVVSGEGKPSHSPAGPAPSSAKSPNWRRRVRQWSRRCASNLPT